MGVNMNSVVNKPVPAFRFWCQKVLPLVYDDSLSYYEVLCKVVDYINHLIETDNQLIGDVDALKRDMATVMDWINNFDTSYAEKIIEEQSAKVIKSVVFGISSAGYFMAMIPESWSALKFGTIQNGELYGHLVLEYD